MPRRTIAAMQDSQFHEAVQGLASGRPLITVMRELGIQRTEFYRVRDRIPNGRDIVARARSDGTWAMIDEAIDIADSERDAQRARVRVDVRLKAAALLNPQEFGPRLDLNVKHSVDPAALHAEALLRLRSGRDQAPQLVAQVIEGERVFAPEPIDSDSLPADSGPASIWD